ncbi:MAG: hypothetical protein ACTSU5_13160 [Promethearchaeota archaeon]
MTDEYRDFRAYDLLDTGEARELDMEIEDVGKYLNPSQVFLFVRMDLRRIFIWKGSVSPVRKRFISSRVAQQMQSDLVKEGGRQCKIVSIDQGDELDEFLNAFNLESMPVTETLEDLYYVRNVDKERQELEEKAKRRREEKAKREAEYTSPALKELTGSSTASLDEIEEISKQGSAAATPKPRPVGASTARSSTPQGKVKVPGLSKDLEDQILTKIKEESVPDGYSRLNIIIGTYLYGPIVQKKVVFGKEVESESWERIEEVPGGCTDLHDKYLRIYTDTGAGTINAVEILISDDQSPEFTPVEFDVKDDLLDTITSNALADGERRLNIIMGNALYGPTIQKKVVFGKEVESERWDEIDELPDGCVDLAEKHLRIYADGDSGLITAVEILEGGGGKKPSKAHAEKKAAKKPSKKSSKKSSVKKSPKKSAAKKKAKRTLKKIPSA